MKVIVYGATGMIGKGVLLECLADPGVAQVLAVGRGPSGTQHAKLRDLVVPDLASYSGVEAQLAGYDACFYCLGVSSAGMSEADYTRVTYDFTLAAATAIHAQNPALTFCFVSGASTDATEKGSVMWARVKGKAENAIAKMGFKGAYMFRPGFIRPMKGVVSRTRSYRLIYAFTWPLFGLFGVLFPNQVTTTERIGHAMLNIARRGWSKTILDPIDINAAAAAKA